MNRTVAFLDILGFRSLVETEPAEKLGARLSRIVGDVIPALNRKSGEFSGAPTLFPNVPKGEDLCIAHAFSDSIIFVATDDSEQGCLALLTCALRATQALIVSRLPVRGGIAHGELYIDRTKSLFVGRALTKAYDLEQRQNWIGVAIDSSVPDTFPRLFGSTGPFPEVRGCMFPLYKVPMKSGPIEDLRTLNWRWNLVVKRGTRSLFNAGDDWSAQSKTDAALTYARHIRETGRAYPVDATAIPAEVRTLWVSDEPPTSNPPKHGDEY